MRSLDVAFAVNMLLRKGDILSSIMDRGPASVVGDTRLRCVITDLIRSMTWIRGKLDIVTWACKLS